MSTTELTSEMLDRAVTKNRVEEKIQNYHERLEMCSSEVGMFANDPIQWYHVYHLKDWTKETTEEMKLGTGVHKMLETQSIDTVVKYIPREALNAEGHCKGKVWTDWKQSNPAEFYLKPGETHPLYQIWNHISANSWCMNLIKKGIKEEEHYWFDEDLGVECRMKTDVIEGNALVDWKTTSKKNARTFAQDAVARFYDLRLAFYRRGFRSKFGFDPKIYVVAIQTTGGFRVTPYRMPDAWIDDAEARVLLTVDEMLHFDINAYLDQQPIELQQPHYSQLNLETVE